MGNNQKEQSKPLPTIEILSTGFRGTTFTVDGVKYQYDNDICCHALYKYVSGNERIEVWSYCDYNPNNKYGKIPKFMKQVFDMIESPIS